MARRPKRKIDARQYADYTEIQLNDDLSMIVERKLSVLAFLEKLIFLMIHLITNIIVNIPNQ